MNGVSLFSGIGGLEFGLEALVQTRLYCENDPRAQKLLQERMQEGLLPAAPIHKDVKTLDRATIEEACSGEPVDIVTAGFPCFVAGTLVLTDAGYRPIEDVRVGDLVVTHRGRLRPVVQVHETRQAPTVVVHADGSPSVRCTPDHPFLCCRREQQRWRPARSLRGGMVCRVLPRVPVPRMPDHAWYVAGLVAAGGHVPIEHGVVGVRVRQELAEQLRELVPGVQVVRLGPDAMLAVVADRHVADACDGWQRYGPVLAGDAARAFLEGYCARSIAQAEAQEETGGNLCLPAADLGTTLMLCHLGQSALGVVPCVHQHGARTVVYMGRPHREGAVDGQYATVRVSSVEPAGTATVHNLGVDEDESYVAHGLVVHNCQDLSTAGARRGLAGERSGLFYEILRLVEQEIHPKPRYLLLENVQGIFSRGVEEVVARVSQAGYDVRWACVPAAALGAHHRRERFFLLARRRDEGDGQQGHVAHTKELRRTALPPHVPEPDHRRAQQLVQRLAARQRSLQQDWLAEPGVGRVVDGLPQGVDLVLARLHQLGNAVVPAQGQFAFRLLNGLAEHA